MQYARDHGGRCSFSYCSAPGSQPGRIVSFYPLKPHVMAMAISRDSEDAWGVAMAPLSGERPSPAQPVWVSIPSEALQRRVTLPGVASNLANLLAKADTVNVSAGLAENRMELGMEAICPSPDSASSLVSQLDQLGGVLRSVRDKDPAKSGSLLNLLAGGTFRRDGAKVYGQWPMQRTFVEALANGTLK